MWRSEQRLPHISSTELEDKAASTGLAENFVWVFMLNIKKNWMNFLAIPIKWIFFFFFFF